MGWVLVITYVHKIRVLLPPFNLLSLLISIHQELDPIKAFKNFQPRRMFYAFNAYLNLVYIRVSEVNLVASQATCTK